MKPALVAAGAVLTVVLGVVIALQLFGGQVGGRQTASSTPDLPSASSTYEPPGAVFDTASPPEQAQPTDEALPTAEVSPTDEVPATDQASAPDQTLGAEQTPTSTQNPDGPAPAPVAAAIEKLKKSTKNPYWVPLDVSTFDPTADISAVTVTASATGVGQVQVLLFHKSRYLGRGTLRAVVSAVVDTNDGAPPATVGVNYQWDPQVPYSSGIFGSEKFIAFHWNGSRAVMEGDLPDAAFD